MLISIVLSIIVLPELAFLIVCILGFHRALVNQSPVRAQIEFLGANAPARHSASHGSQCSSGTVAIQKWSVG